MKWTEVMNKRTLIILLWSLGKGIPYPHPVRACLVDSEGVYTGAMLANVG